MRFRSAILLCALLALPTLAAAAEPGRLQLPDLSANVSTRSAVIRRMK